MAINDLNRVELSDVERAERKIRQRARQLVMSAKQFIDGVQSQCDAVGKSALVTELGDDSAQLATLYTDACSLVNNVTGETFPTIGELP